MISAPLNKASANETRPPGAPGGLVSIHVTRFQTLRRPPMVKARIAFCTWSRFSAWS